MRVLRCSLQAQYEAREGCEGQEQEEDAEKRERERERLFSGAGSRSLMGLPVSRNGQALP